MDSIIPIKLALAIHYYTPALMFGVFSICVILALLFVHFRRDALVFMISFIVTDIVGVTLKYIFAVPRPENALIPISGYAFPSNHAALSMFFAFMFSWFIYEHTHIRKSYRYMLQSVIYIPAVVVGLSRLTIHVHTPFQVIVGSLIGILVPFLLLSLDRFYQNR